MKALIIHDSSGFMIESIEENLEKAGFETALVPPKLEKAGPELFDTDIIFLYLGEYIDDSRELLEKLRDITAEEEKPLCVIGYEGDMLRVEEVIPPNYIAYRFIRPFDVKALVQKAERLASVPPSPKGQKRRVLLVDDDTTYLKTVLRFLGEMYEVTAVRSGEHALKYLRSNTPELILLDYDMPVMSGAQTLEKMRQDKRTADIPVVFLTGVSDRASVINVMHMRPEGYVLKNSGRDDLLLQVKGFFIASKWKKVR